MMNNRVGLWGGTVPNTGVSAGIVTNTGVSAGIVPSAALRKPIQMELEYGT